MVSIFLCSLFASRTIHAFHAPCPQADWSCLFASSSHSERLFGSFSRSFNFPRSADLASVKARFDQGLLRIDVPKKAEEQQRTRKVEIEDVREKL